MIERLARMKNASSFVIHFVGIMEMLTYRNLRDNSQGHALHVIQQLSLRRRDERLVRPQQGSVVIPYKSERVNEDEERG